MIMTTFVWQVINLVFITILSIQIIKKNNDNLLEIVNIRLKEYFYTYHVQLSLKSIASKLPP